ncbi:MAG TPA: PKD domain-containing protein [Candidatus Thermoplasmatota archaeon]|nr:PKD domain-containing protein [Candidatus Thermoplasmatota archaeon]
MKKIISIAVVGIFVLSGVGTVAGIATKNLLNGPYGPSEGYVGVEYTFFFDLPVNPNGDEYYVIWEWGDGNMSSWLGPFPPGQTTEASHAWMHAGVYEIRVKLKDPNGTESVWSDPHTITILNNPVGVSFIKGGWGVSFLISNSGNETVTNISWDYTINMTLGLIFYGGTQNGTIPSLEPQSSERIQRIPIGAGFAKIYIHIDGTLNHAHRLLLMGPFVQLMGPLR